MPKGLDHHAAVSKANVVQELEDKKRLFAKRYGDDQESANREIVGSCLQGVDIIADVHIELFNISDWSKKEAVKPVVSAASRCFARRSVEVARQRGSQTARR